MNYLPPDIYPCTNSIYVKNVAPFILRCMDKLFRMRDWIEGTHQNDYLFIYYNVYKALHGAVAAYTKIKSLNEQMLEPLCDKEIKWIAVHSDTTISSSKLHGDGVRVYTPKNIPDMLELEPDIAEASGFYDSVKNKQQYAVKKQEKIQRNNIIAELYLTYKYKSPQIATELTNRGMSCSEQTVRNVINNSNLKQYTCYNEYITAIKYRFPNEKWKKLYETYQYNKASSDSDEQKKIIETLLTDTGNILLLGEAGTGKSTLINTFIEKSDKCIARCTFTGMATIQIKGAKTSHSLLKIKIKDVYTDADVKSCSSLKKVDILIIDEISMVRMDLFEVIIKIIKESEHKYGHKIQLILCGDLSQLSPFVNAESKDAYKAVYKNKEYFFESDLFEKLELKKLLLKHVYRQSDQAFLDILGRVRFCEQSVMELLKTDFDNQEHYDAIYLCQTNKQVDTINHEHAENYIVTRPHVIKADFLTSEGNITLAVGMPVMLTQNHYRYKNGELGVITYINLKAKKIKVRVQDGKVKEVSYVRNIKNPDEFILPVRRGYAITIHKCQGLTIADHINILCDSDFFEPAMLYVALSRATCKEYVHLINYNLTEKSLCTNKSYLRAVSYMV